MRFKLRRGFSLLEVITVILIIGIIGGGSIQILLNLYRSYSSKLSLNRADSRSYNSLMQLTTLLENRVEGSLITANGSEFSELNESEADGTALTLEWVGVDYDGFLGGWRDSLGEVMPYWSGFIDLEDDHNQSLIVLGDENDLSSLQESIEYLSNGKVDINSTSNPVAIFFKTGNYNNANDGFGWYNSDSYGAYKVYNSENNWSSTESNFTVSRKKAIIYEQYQLSWTAYGLRSEKILTDIEGLDIYNIFLDYNYRPWNGDSYLDGNSNLLLSGVTDLTFRKIGSTVHLYICVDTNYPNLSFDENEQDSKLCRRVVIY